MTVARLFGVRYLSDPPCCALTRVRELVAAVPDPGLQPYPVSRKVNSVRNKGPELLDPVTTGLTARHVS